MSAPDREQEKQKSVTVGLDMLKMSLFFIMIIIIMKKKKMLNIVDYKIHHCLIQISNSAPIIHIKGNI